MSNNKQSSVEILCQKIANKLGLQAITFYIDHAEEIAEARTMHKAEMIEAHINGQAEFDTGARRLKNDELAEKHYKETFEK